jgi:hypothetical protein
MLVSVLLISEQNWIIFLYIKLLAKRERERGGEREEKEEGVWYSQSTTFIVFVTIIFVYSV